MEGEAFAVTDALDKARYVVLGCSDQTVAVDHKSLLKIFGDRSLVDVPNTRLRKLKEKTLRYRFKLTHIPGVKHRVADGLSRYPSHHDDCITSASSACHEIEWPSNIPYLPISFLDNIRRHDPPSSTEDAVVVQAEASLGNVQSITWDTVRVVTSSNTMMNSLRDTIESGMPEHKSE